ncbi:MAG TPA: ribonuclease III domain-containing protein [Candidatus Saccharimonadales bacterium]|nr:ribonuclease III domain-containing protein [Candidatus Saccharimonadales bacterium]
MSLIDDKVARLNALLIESYEELRNIDNNLLTLVLTRNKNALSAPLRKKLVRDYGSDNHQRLETLGDAVLELIVVDYLFEYGLNMGFAQHVVNNISLYCLASHKGLCDLIIPQWHLKAPKMCADVFEALVGAIYLHLKLNTTIKSITFISTWLAEQFNLTNLIIYLINHPNEKNVCQAISIYKLQPSQSKVEREIFKTSQANVESEITSRQQPSFKTSQANVQHEITSRLQHSFKTLLDNFYKEHNIKRPVNYKIIQSHPYTVIINCPFGLSCDEKSIIGHGESSIRIEAEERAAKTALEYLQYLLMK